MIAYTHDATFVLASLAVVMMAGFTGLSLTRGASGLATPQRKLVVTMSAVALGGGVWSMHFVAMLGLRLPVEFYYDPLITLISALVAILITGLALLILHFRPRSARSITLAGAIVGAGIPVMHFIGMSGIELCRPVYTPGGVVLAFAASVLLGIAAMRIAYSERGRANIVLGTVVFGVAVFSVHFLAMGSTGFVAATALPGQAAGIGNPTLVILVTLSAFVISGAFLLTGITFFPTRTVAAPQPVPPPAPPARPPGPRSTSISVPYEKEGRTLFVESTAIAGLRAEGHYSLLFHGADSHLCPWSISEAEERLGPAGFLRVHRSYLLNPRHITGFERGKDGGQVFLAASPALGPVPVSRTRIADLRAALGV